MIKVKMKSKGRKLINIRQAIKKLDGEATQLGYFRSQGMHWQGVYTYTALAQALETGFFPATGLQRTPLPFMVFIGDLTVNKLKKSMLFKSALKTWRTNLHNRSSQPHKLLAAVGEVGVDESMNVFGNKKYFPQAPWNPTPVFETGDLARNFTYKVTSNNMMKR